MAHVTTHDLGAYKQYVEGQFAKIKEWMDKSEEKAVVAAVAEENAQARFSVLDANFKTTESEFQKHVATFKSLYEQFTQMELIVQQMRGESLVGMEEIKKQNIEYFDAMQLKMVAYEHKAENTVSEAKKAFDEVRGITSTVDTQVRGQRAEIEKAFGEVQKKMSELEVNSQATVAEASRAFANAQQAFNGVETSYHLLHNKLEHAYTELNGRMNVL